MKVKCSEAISFYFFIISQLSEEKKEALNTGSLREALLYGIQCLQTRKETLLKTQLFVLWNLYTFNSNRREP